MEAMQAIKTRKTVRGFKPDPVPKEILERIMEAPRYASSWANTQPWEFAILGGDVMEEVRETLFNKPDTGEGFNPDYEYAEFSGACQKRFEALGQQLMRIFEIRPGNQDDYNRMMATMRRNLDAPHMIVAYLDRSLKDIVLFDLGAAVQLITMTAHIFGVGCCVMASTVGYPDDLRRILSIPDSKRIIVGIAVGYPDPDSLRNKIDRQREPVDNYTTWYGF